MDNLDYIDNYYQNEHDSEQTRLFEEMILRDPAFAADLAFYLSARQTAKDNYAEDSRERFRNLYQSEKTVNIARGRKVNMRVLYYAAAAIFAAVLLGVFIANRPSSPQQLAERYINKEFQDLSVTMGRGDALQNGSDLYNAKNYQGALDAFEQMIKTDSSNAQALEYAGKSCIKLGQYEKAAAYFKQMEKLQTYGNAGKFYEALTFMMRNGVGDKEKARELLQEVVTQDLDNKEIASEWLKAAW